MHKEQSLPFPHEHYHFNRMPFELRNAPIYSKYGLGIVRITKERYVRLFWRYCHLLLSFIVIIYIVIYYYFLAEYQTKYNKFAKQLWQAKLKTIINN